MFLFIIRIKFLKFYFRKEISIRKKIIKFKLLYKEFILLLEYFY